MIREWPLTARALIRLGTVVGLVALICGVRLTPTPPAGAVNAPTYTLIDLGQPSAFGPIYISPNSGLVLDLGLDELYDINTGAVTDVSSPPTGFTPIQMNDDGQVVGNLLAGPDEGGAIWTPATDAIHLVSLSTTVHTLQGGLCPGLGPATNCPYEIQAAPIFTAQGINDNGDVVGEIRTQFDDDTGAQFGEELNSNDDTFAAEAPGGNDADFTGTIPSGLVFPFDQVGPGYFDQCSENENALVQTDTYTTAYAPYAGAAFAINDSNQILGSPCDGPTFTADGVPEVWTSGGSLSATFPADHGYFSLQPQLFNNRGDYVVGAIPSGVPAETLIHSNGITVPILDPGGFIPSSVGGLNDSEDVVGTGAGGAFVWSPDAADGVTLQSLIPDDLGLTLRTGLGIDNDGDVVGTAADSNGHTHDYVAVPGPVPIITAVSPGGGPVAGGNVITISGTGFQASGLTFKGVEFDPEGGTPLDGTNAQVVSDTEITVTVPDGTSTANGRASFLSTVAADFTDSDSLPDDSLPDTLGDNDYVFGAPVIDSVAPGGGPLGGANQVTITGSGFDNPVLSFAGVEFDPLSDTSGDDAAALLGTNAHVVSDTEITVDAPDFSTAAADDDVSSIEADIMAGFDVAGTSDMDNSVPNAVGDNDYVFGAPVIDSVAPGGGALNGGNQVTITGSGFDNPVLSFAGVEFDPLSDTSDDAADALLGTNAQVVSDTEITVDAPDFSTVAADDDLTSIETDITAGFDITGTSDMDSSVANAVGDNDYVFGAPVIDSVAPGGGPLSGANQVAITGSGFDNPALTFEGVEFDPLSDTSDDAADALLGTNAQVVSDTEITVDAPDFSTVAADDDLTSIETDITAGFTVTGSSETDNSVANSVGDNDYVFGAPVIDSVSPGGGPLGGGDTLTITGSGFENSLLTFEGVEFDPLADTSSDAAAALLGTHAHIVSDTEITVDAPDFSSEAADDDLTSIETDITAGFDVAGTSDMDNSVANAVGDNDYVFGAPVIDSVAPGNGALNGGNQVTITGSGFDNPALTFEGVEFDPLADSSSDAAAALLGTNAHVVSDTVITVDAPDFSPEAADDDATGIETDITAGFDVAGTSDMDNSVANAVGDNDYVFGVPTAPSCGSLSDCQGATNTDPDGSATATSTASGGTITADGSGAGGITVGHYSSDPVGAPSFAAAGSFFDVSVSDLSDFDTVTITDCDLSGGNAIQWWNPAANSGHGAWVLVTPQSQTGGTPPCVTMTLSSTSSPNIAQLTGTVFGVAIVTPPSGGGGGTPPPTTTTTTTTTTTPNPPSPPSAPGPPTRSGAPSSAAGYLVGASNGGVFNFGDATFEGSAGNFRLNQPIVGMAATPDGKGYWLVASDGGVFNFGDAAFEGSAGNLHLNKSIVGMAATRDGKGYWLVASDGGVFNFGDAAFEGSAEHLRLNKPIVGMAATPDGKGYWLVASDGGVFNFGDAAFEGSAGNLHLNKPIVGMAATPDGKGYWLVASEGGVFNFGDAAFEGSAEHLRLNKPIVGMAATPDGKGFWLVASDGGVFAFGDAPFEGSAAVLSRSPVVAISSIN